MKRKKRKLSGGDPVDFTAHQLIVTNKVLYILCLYGVYIVYTVHIQSTVRATCCTSSLFICMQVAIGFIYCFECTDRS